MVSFWPHSLVRFGQALVLNNSIQFGFGHVLFCPVKVTFGLSGSGPVCSGSGFCPSRSARFWSYIFLTKEGRFNLFQVLGQPVTFWLEYLSFQFGTFLARSIMIKYFYNVVSFLCTYKWHDRGFIVSFSPTSTPYPAPKTFLMPNSALFPLFHCFTGRR